LGRWFAAAILVLVGVAVIANGGIHTGGSSSNYGKADIDGTCSGNQISVGGTESVKMSIRNTGTNSWPATIVSIDGTSNFVRNSFTDDSGTAGVDLGSGQWQFPSLAAGATMHVDADYTAKGAGNATFNLSAWGDQPQQGGMVSIEPDNLQQISCPVAINP
jgi:hypothetical protein